MNAAQLEFPTRVSQEPETVNRNFVWFRHTLPEDRRYHFSILLPDTWRVDTATPDEPTPAAPIKTLAAFTTRRRQASVGILAVRLARDVAPADWLELLLEERGEQVLSWRETDTPGGRVADILSRLETPRGTWVSRWLALKDGNVLFVVRCRTREQDYPDYADTFLLALDSFRLLSPCDWPFAEPVQALNLPISPGLAVILPKSWQIRRDQYDNANVRSFQVTNQTKDGSIGTMTVAGIARSAESDPQNLAVNYVRELRRNHVGICNIPLDAADAGGPFDAVWRGRAEALLRGQKVEVRVFVGQCGAAWFFAGSLGAARQTHAGAWAINKRAFEILVDYAHFAADDQPANDSTTSQEIVSEHRDRTPAP